MTIVTSMFNTHRTHVIKFTTFVEKSIPSNCCFPSPSISLASSETHEFHSPLTETKVTIMFYKRNNSINQKDRCPGSLRCTWIIKQSDTKLSDNPVMPTLDYYTKSAMCPDATTTPPTMSCTEICHGILSSWLRLRLAGHVMHHETDTQQIHPKALRKEVVQTWPERHHQEEHLPDDYVITKCMMCKSKSIATNKFLLLVNCIRLEEKLFNFD